MNVSIERHQHFATSIFATTHPAFASLRDGLRDELLARSRNEPTSDVTNVGSWHSRSDLQHDTTPVIRDVAAFVEAFVTASLGGLYDNWSAVRPDVFEMWAILGGRGARHGAHTHPCDWSGVFYVDAEHCIAASDAIGDPRAGSIEFVNPNAASHAFLQPGTIAYPPKDGLLLLFPAALVHIVNPNPSDRPRVVMSFNVRIAARAK